MTQVAACPLTRTRSGGPGDHEPASALLGVGVVRNLCLPVRAEGQPHLVHNAAGEETSGITKWVIGVILGTLLVLTGYGGGGYGKSPVTAASW